MIKGIKEEIKTEQIITLLGFGATGIYGSLKHMMKHINILKKLY